MTPVVSIVGISKSGKTTLIEKLIATLNTMGYRVATIKNTPNGTTFDDSGKDSQRHIAAGSEATIVHTPGKLFMVKPVSGDTSIDEIAMLFGDEYDIILTEGFKNGSAPKIEVHRKEVGPPLKDIKKLIAIATDEALDTSTRQFSLDDVQAIATFLEEGFIKPQQERLSLFINNTPVSLSAFPRDIINGSLLGMANCLKGVGEIRNLKVFISRGKSGQE